jgi:hypothetical protein
MTSYMCGHFPSLEVMRTCFLILLSLATSMVAFPQVSTQKVLAGRGMKWD